MRGLARFLPTRMLLRAAWRNLGAARKSFAACAVLTALAVSLHLSFLSANDNLDLARELTYHRLRFSHLSYQVRGLPRGEVARLRQIDGVEAAEGRIVLPSEFLDGSGNISSLLIGLPSGRRPSVNDLEVLEGNYLSRERGQLLLESRFAKRHRIEVGSRVRFKVSGLVREFDVVGLITSPEYLWLARDRFEPLPSPDYFAVAFVGQSELEELHGSDLNQVHLRLSSRADPIKVTVAVSSRLRRFLDGPPIPRERQASHALLLRDRQALRALGTVTPKVFVFLTLVMLFFSFAQLLSLRRREVGILMSQGFSRQQLMSSYLVVSGFVVAAGCLVGLILGALAGRVCTRFYVESLGLPVMVLSFPWLEAGGFLVLSFLASQLATGLAVSRVLALQPATALRSEFAPAATTQFRRIRLPLVWKFPLRNLFRQPGRALVALTAVTFAVAQVTMVSVLRDSQAHTLDFYFQRVHRYDLEVPLRDLYSVTVLPPIHRWEGVQRVEYHLRTNVTLSLGRHRTETLLWGVPGSTTLMGINHRDGRPLSPPSGHGIVMGSTMMSRLEAVEGQVVQGVLEGDPPTARAHSFLLSQQIEDPLASPPLISLSTLQNLVRSQRYVAPDPVNVALVRVEASRLEEVKHRLKSMPESWAVFDVSQKRRQIEDLLRMMSVYLYVLMSFAGVFTVVILVAAGLMNISERTRELAVLACLGLSRATVVKMLLLEAFLIWVAGNVIGFPAGVAAADWVMNSFQNELIQLEPKVSSGTILFATGWSALVYLAACAVVLPRVLKVPLAAALGERLS